MARSPCHEEESGGVKKGPWTPEEDQKLIEYVQKHGGGSWQRMAKLAGLNRCGKSCRLRWTNYLRPDIKRGKFSDEEEQLIIHLHSLLGNKWSSIATRLPGRTDNEIKNYWNTHLRKKLLRKGIDPVTHTPTMMSNNLGLLASLLSSSAANLGNATTCSSSSHLDWINTINALKLRADAAHLVKLQLFQSMILQAFTRTCSSAAPDMELMNLLGLMTTAAASPPTGDLLEELQSSVLPGTSLLKPADEGVAVVPGSDFLMSVESTSSFPAASSTATFSDSISNPNAKINADFIKSSDPILPSASFEGNWDQNLNSLDNLLNDPLLKEILEQIP